MLNGKVVINPQEQEGNYCWTDIPSYKTQGFSHRFGEDAPLIAFTAVALILENYPNNADYFQTFYYEFPDGEKVKFWIINDVTHYTALLPSEY